MQFVPVKELRSNIKQIRQRLEKEKEIVLTSNGKPFALLIPISDNALEEVLTMLRQFRTYISVAHLQERSVKKGKDKISLEQINAEIATVRRKRK